MNSARVPRSRNGAHSRPEDCLETLYAFAADGARRQGMRVQSSVENVTDAPYAGYMNLQVPPQLEAKLSRLTAETGRPEDAVHCRARCQPDAPRLVPLTV